MPQAPQKRPRTSRTPDAQRPVWVRGAAWAGSLSLHGAALLGLAYVVVGAFKAEQVPPRLDVSQQRALAASRALVAWERPPSVEQAPEPLEAPPDLPPLELSDPTPTRQETGSPRTTKRFRAAEAVRPPTQPSTPTPRTPAAPKPTPPVASPPAVAAKPAASAAPKAAAPTTAARVRSRATPARPSRCRRRGHVGTVVVQLYVGPDGLPYHPKVKRSSGCTRLDEAAVAAVRQYRFHPATEGGQPVASRERIVIHFRPQT